MEEEDTRDYKEPCPQCSEVNWGISDEGKFYCRSCHTVIEKTKDVDESELFVVNAKIQSVSRGLRKGKALDRGWEWYICEGFQFILLKQAEALETLGVDPRIKDEVICNFWRRYLQKTQEAYCNRPATKNRQPPGVSQSSAASSDLDSGPEIFSSAFSSDTDGESVSNVSLNLPYSGGYTSASDTEPTSRAASVSASSVCSGSVDGTVYRVNKRSGKKMSMPMTLAFCYLSLLWLRESITLSDLLRLVINRHVPYFNPEQYFPEQTKICWRDNQIFRVQFFPVYREIIKLTHELGVLLDLPCFPSITETCFYHPNVLCMKYLMEVNLPDELHNWTYRVAKKTGLDDVTTLTYDPVRKQARCIPYDIQAVAIIIVALKIVFVLNDDWEWQLSDIASKRNETEGLQPVFDFRNWYETMDLCMKEVQQKLDEERARFSWKSERVIDHGRKVKSMIVKRKQMTKNLLKQFSRLAGTTPDAGNQGPSTFLFNWEEQNTGKISFHGHSLEGITQLGSNLLSGLRTYYWFSCLKKCKSHNICDHWRLYDKTKFPRSYDFVLSLFSLILGVEISIIHQEVGLVEENLFKDLNKKKPKKKAKKSQT